MNLRSPSLMTPAPAVVPFTGNSPPLSSGETVLQALTRAQAAALALRYEEAANICNDVLAIAPHHPDALASLGIIVARAGSQERGIALLRRAIHLQPGMQAGTPTSARNTGRPASSTTPWRKARRRSGWTPNAPITSSSWR